MGGSSSKDSGVALKGAFPAFVCNNGIVRELRHGKLYDQHFAARLGGLAADDIRRDGAVQLERLFGVSAASAIVEAMDGGRKPFTLRVDEPTPAELAASGAPTASVCISDPSDATIHGNAKPVYVVGHVALDGCCAVDAWVLHLLTEPQAAAEPALSARGVSGPLIFRCSGCGRHSGDGVRYGCYAELVGRLRSSGASVLHKIAASKCRGCRGARATSEMSDTPCTRSVASSQNEATWEPRTPDFRSADQLSDTSTPEFRDARNGEQQPVATGKAAIVVVAVNDSLFARRVETAVRGIGAQCYVVPAREALAVVPAASHVVVDLLSSGATPAELRKAAPRVRVLAAATNDAFGGAAQAAGADGFISRGASDVQIRIALYDFVTDK